MNGETKAWLVDLDGTLYRALPVKAAMAFEIVTAGFAHLGLLRRFRHEHERLRATPVEGGSPFDAQIDRTASVLGLPPAEVRAVVQEWMIRRPLRHLARARRDAFIEELLNFRAQGGRTAVVSDYPALEKLGALRVRELFDTVVANGEPGGPARLKPDPAGYLAAAERLGVGPGACLVIGDRDDADGEAARRAGMRFRHI